MNILIKKSQLGKIKSILSENNYEKIEVPIEQLKVFEKLLNRYMSNRTDWWKMVKLESIKLLPIGSRGYNMHLTGILLLDSDWVYENAKDVGTNIKHILEPVFEESEYHGISLGDIVSEGVGNEIREIILPFATTFFSKNIIHSSLGGLTITTTDSKED